MSLRRIIPKNQQEEIASTAGIDIEEVEDACAPITRPHTYGALSAKYKLLDTMLSHMASTFVATTDPLSQQQLSNSILQTLNKRTELENTSNQTSNSAADEMDAEAERVTARMLHFGGSAE